jgi:hypothetical protein
MLTDASKTFAVPRTVIGLRSSSPGSGLSTTIAAGPLGLADGVADALGAGAGTEVSTPVARSIPLVHAVSAPTVTTSNPITCRTRR